MDEAPPPPFWERPGRLAALSAAALAAALFTPVPAAADVTAEVRERTAFTAASAHSIVSNVDTAVRPTDTQLLADTLISAGSAGVVVAVGGLVLVSWRRRQW